MLQYVGADPTRKQNPGTGLEGPLAFKDHLWVRGMDSLQIPA